jgi:ketosteroid isomerase-like protein
MASELEARVREMYRAFDLDNFDPECEWHLRADLPDSRVLLGHDEIARNVASWYEAFGELVVEPGEVSEVGGKIVADVRLRGRITGSGEEVEMDEVHVVTISDGKVVEVREYLTREEAICSLGPAAAARSEPPDE